MRLPSNWLTIALKIFLNEKFLHTPVTLTVEKKEFFIVLPYLGNLSLAFLRSYSFLNDFKIFASSNLEFQLKIAESLLISRDKPELNRNEKSLPLYLFD